MEIKCDNCGNKIEKRPSHINEHNFCDGKCYGEWRSKNIKGENHPQYIKPENRKPELPYPSKTIFSQSENGITIIITCVVSSVTGDPLIYCRSRKLKNGGMETNKECASYLGVYVGERVLSKIYDNVTLAPPHNPGYDFICGKGYRIDVKTACLSKHNYWQFGIRKNIIADYFLCLAFDNRDDLNPQHIWLVPSKIVNNKMNISIPKSNIKTWSEYEQNNLDKIINCCNNMKNDNY